MGRVGLDESEHRRDAAGPPLVEVRLLQAGDLSVGADPPRERAHRIRQAFATRGVKASIGFSRRTPALGLQAAFEEADQRMYAEKRAR